MTASRQCECWDDEAVRSLKVVLYGESEEESPSLAGCAPATGLNLAWPASSAAPSPSSAPGLFVKSGHSVCSDEVGTLASRKECVHHLLKEANEHIRIEKRDGTWLIEARVAGMHEEGDLVALISAVCEVADLLVAIPHSSLCRVALGEGDHSSIMLSIQSACQYTGRAGNISQMLRYRRVGHANGYRELEEVRSGPGTFNRGIACGDECDQGTPHDVCAGNTRHTEPRGVSDSEPVLSIPVGEPIPQFVLIWCMRRLEDCR